MDSNLPNVTRQLGSRARTCARTEAPRLLTTVTASSLPQAPATLTMVLNSSDLSPTLWLLGVERPGDRWATPPRNDARTGTTFLALQDWTWAPILTLFSFCVVPGDLSTPMAPPLS